MGDMSRQATSWASVVLDTSVRLPAPISKYTSRPPPVESSTCQRVSCAWNLSVYRRVMLNFSVF